MSPTKRPIDYTSSESEDTNTDIKPHISSTLPSTPKKEIIPKKTKTPTPKKVKSSAANTSNNSEGWSPQDRLNLFEAFVSTVEVKWDEVAAKMGPYYTGKQCREQWQRATGKRIRKALGEE
ncbi:uncharacterized protein L199_002445 [Kwoniella botswanensis]|uniref:uncharacterized protein n=1 Tax=Kwoniella botswanensis TaxID=1268659 RepID=UPI00315C9680